MWWTTPENDQNMSGQKLWVCRLWCLLLPSTTIVLLHILTSWPRKLGVSKSPRCYYQLVPVSMSRMYRRFLLQLLTTAPLVSGSLVWSCLQHILFSHRHQLAPVSTPRKGSAPALFIGRICDWLTSTSETYSTPWTVAKNVRWQELAPKTVTTHTVMMSIVMFPLYTD